MMPKLFLFLSLVLCAIACARRPEPAASASPGTPAAGPARPAVLCLGTSLTAGLGLDPQLAWPALLQQKVDAAGLPFEVVNAGVSGETSAGALRRLDWLMQRPAAVMVIETGANDGLRGQEPDALRENLRAIVVRAQQQQPPPKLVIVGMEAPPNYGAAYAARFRAVYPEVARESGAVLLPFLLEGVGGVPSLNQADGVHPTAAGHEIMAETVWTVVGPMLQGPPR